ncbi:MAG: DUF4440 domain-containing protein [Bryobacteraceae bacterium]
MEASETLRQLEEELLQTATRKNAARVALLLANEFLEFGASGRVYSKAEMIGLLQREAPAALSMKNFQVRMLANNAALVTYRAIRAGQGAATESLRSSVWIHRENRWQIVFHQGTTVPGSGR